MNNSVVFRICLFVCSVLLLQNEIFACTPTTINWTGDVDSDWNNAANYSGAPANSVRVVINPSNYTGAAASPAIGTNSSFEPNTVEVQNAANLAIQANLTLRQNIFAGSAFIVDGSGSLVNMSAGNLDIAFFGQKRNLGIQNSGAFNTTGGTLYCRDFSIDATSSSNLSNGTMFLTRDFLLTGSMNFNSGNVNIEGDFNNAGTYTQPGGTVIFDGNGGQSIIGATNFANITVNKSGNLNVSSGNQGISGTLTLTNGNFNTNNALTLLSTGSGTARIAAITGGGITGNITMERYIDGTYGWKLLGSAVSGQTLGDWDDDIYMSGVNGIDGNACCPIWYSVYTYDESVLGPFQDFGWVTVTDTSTAIGVGQGFWTWVQPLPEMIRVEGPPNTGATNIPVTFNSSGVPADDGWNLVSNPYPSTISWDNPGWTKTNVANATYIWSQSVPGWASYINGFGTNGGTQYIASSQGFLMQAYAPSPVLAVTEPVKSSVNPSFFKTAPAQQNFFRLKAEGNNKADEIIFHFDANATTSFDYSTDARDLYADWPNGIPNFSSISTDNLDLSINGLPELTQDMIIPLRLFTNINGNHTITLDETNMSQTSCIVLEDTYNSIFTDLEDTSYAFNLDDTTQAPRFLLHITAPIAKEVVDVSCQAANDGLAIAKGSGNGPWDYEWKDAQDNVLQTTINTNGADTLSELAPGEYTVSIINYTGVCGSAKDTLTVSEPSVLDISSTENEVSCYGLADGLIDVTTSGGTAPYSFLWSNNETSEDLTNISAGSYNLTITDNNGCILTESYTISEPVEIQAAFDVSRDTVYISLGGVLLLSNTSLGGDSYYWDFGDGDFSTLENPLHTYYTAGNYTITLQVSNGICGKIATYQVVVLATPEDATEPNNDYYVELIRINKQYYLDIRMEERKEVQVVVFSSIGQEIYKTAVNMKEGKTLLNLQGYSAGVYMLRATFVDEVYSRKLIVE